MSGILIYIYIIFIKYIMMEIEFVSILIETNNYKENDNVGTYNNSNNNN